MEETQIPESHNAMRIAKRINVRILTKYGKQAILEGKFVCDPIQFPDRMGLKTIEMILKHFNGDEVPPEILIKSELYYKQHAEQDPELKKAP